MSASFRRHEPAVPGKDAPVRDVIYRSNMDTERVERALIDYMVMTEVSPTEGGHVEAKAATMAGRVLELSAMRVRRAKAVLLEDTVVIRVEMVSARGTPKCRRTVTAGTDAFQQLVSEALVEIPSNLVSGAVDALRPVLAAQADRIAAEVSEFVKAVANDSDHVAAMRAKVVRKRELKIKKERENLVSCMLGLLTDGWTRDMLLESLDAATCRSVMGA